MAQKVYQAKIKPMVSSLRNGIFMIVCGSVLLGFVLSLAPAILFCIFCTGILLSLMYINTGAEDRGFILSIVISALILRIAALLLLQNYCLLKDTLDIMGDASDNLSRGFIIADFLRGEIPNIRFSLSFKEYNSHIVTIFNGIFSALFGKDAFSLKYINILCVLLSGWLIYDLTLRIFNSRAARITLAIVLFFPTLFLWSITDLKEGHFILAIVTMLWSEDIAMRKNKSVRNRIIFLVLFILSAIYAVLIRANLMVPFITIYFGVMLVYFLFRGCASDNYIQKGISQISLLILVLMLIFAEKNIFQTARYFYEQMIAMNTGFLNSGGWNYNVIGDPNQNHYTFQFLARYTGGSWLHLLLEPFPWRVSSLKILIFYPVTIFWYIVLIFSFLGLIKVFRAGKTSEFFPIIAFLFLYSIIIGMIVSNIGTVVRLRDTVLPFVAILFSVGLTQGLNDA